MDAADGGTLTRVRVDVAYDGSDFHGWARQPGLRTVQGELEAALARIFRRQSAPGLTVAGRTDVGVHATGQVAHLDLDEGQLARLARRRDGGAWGAPDAVASLARKLNGIAGARGDLHVAATTPAADGFDARFSAVWRRYEYRIADATASRDPRRRGHTLWLPARLDVAAMRAAATSLLGLRDFAAFCRPREGATTIRTLQGFSWRRDRGGVLVADLRADAFCHSMVRALVGACVAAGERRLAAEDVVSLQSAGERSSAFTVMPAKGLTLVEVGYPPDAELAERAEQTRARRALPEDGLSRS